MKTLWYINYYTSTPDRVSNPRSIELSEHAAAEYNVRVIIADCVEYNDQKSQVPIGMKYANMIFGKVKYTIVKAPSYKSNIQRGISIWRWASSLKKLPKALNEKPDIILFNIHAPFDYPVIRFAHSIRAKLIVEAWDLWPDSFVRFGLMKASNPVTKLFYHVERKMYENADRIIFTFEGGKDYLKNMGWLKGNGGKISEEKIHYINNGINIKKFNKDCSEFPTMDEDLLNNRIFKVVYMGSVRLVNNVKTLIDAADLLKENLNIRMFIYGDGTDRDTLERYVKENHVSNVVFKSRHTPFNEVADIVRHADLNIMNYQKGLGDYGLSSGKQFLYFAAGKPIICNIAINYDEISRNNIGIARALDTPQKYADAILEIASMSAEQLKEMHARTMTTAKRFDYDKLSEEFITVVRSFE